MIDRPALGEFLRRRREALQPEDVGMPRWQRRRATGLRREEVAALCHMSSDYYARLERERGPQPSEQMVASIAQGLHLSLEERDHLFRLAGHQPPVRGASTDHVSPGLLRIFDRLGDTPAEIVTELDETLRQTPLAAALIGDAASFTGPERSRGYRWFADPSERERFVPEDREYMSRLYAAGLRIIVGLRGPDSRAAWYRDLLLDESEEFRELWAAHEVGLRPRDGSKRYQHPEVGRIELDCQTLLDPDQSHRLMVYTARPGTENHEKLQALAVSGTVLLASRSDSGVDRTSSDG